MLGKLQQEGLCFPFSLEAQPVVVGGDGSVLKDGVTAASPFPSPSGLQALCYSAEGKGAHT